jgi:ATP-dependent RNA/DNA helicase IGHMBP2
MTNQIGDLIRKLFYSENLKNGRSEDVEDGILWIDYVPTQTWPFDDVDSTEKQRIYNLNECEIISDVLMELNGLNSGASVAIIAPYKHQVLTLRKLIKIESLSNLVIDIDTVDGFQGKECEVLIYSLTRTVGSFRFLANARRLNVALSRARDRIIIIGNLDYARKNNLLNAVSDSSKIYTYNSKFVV